MGVEIFEGLQTRASPGWMGLLSDVEVIALLIVPNKPLRGIVSHLL